MPKPQAPVEAEIAEEAVNAVDASALEGTKGYNHISPGGKEISQGHIMNQNPPKWDHLIK